MSVNTKITVYWNLTLCSFRQWNSPKHHFARCLNPDGNARNFYGFHVVNSWKLKEHCVLNICRSL